MTRTCVYCKFCFRNVVSPQPPPRHPPAIMHFQSILILHVPMVHVWDTADPSMFFAWYVNVVLLEPAVAAAPEVKFASKNLSVGSKRKGKRGHAFFILNERLQGKYMSPPLLVSFSINAELILPCMQCVNANGPQAVIYTMGLTQSFLLMTLAKPNQHACYVELQCHGAGCRVRG